MRFVKHLSVYPLAMLLFVAPAAAADNNTIVIKKFMFNPMNVTVPAGSEVTWDNQDGEPHTVVSVSGDFRSQALDEKDKFSHRFDKPGTYKYLCTIHPRMVGTITVVAK